MSIIINEIRNEALRKAAEYADNTKNGGNNNGILESNEESLFTRKASESFSDPNVVNDYAKLLGYDAQKKDNNINKKSNNIKRVNYSKLSYGELNKRYNMLKKVKQEVNKSDIYKKNENGFIQLGCSTIMGSLVGAVGGTAVAEAGLLAGISLGGVGLLVFGVGVAIGYGAPKLYQHFKNEGRKDDLKYIFDVDNEEDLRNIVANIDDIDFELKIMEDEIKSRQVDNRTNSLAELGQ